MGYFKENATNWKLRRRASSFGDKLGVKIAGGTAAFMSSLGNKLRSLDTL